MAKRFFNESLLLEAEVLKIKAPKFPCLSELIYTHMQSFKLGKSKSSKKELMSVGGLLIILGLVGAVLVHNISWLFVGIGILIVLIPAFVTEEDKKEE